MDDLNKVANQKDQEAEQLRKDASYNKDNPKIQIDLESAARGLEQDAASLRSEVVEEAAEEVATQLEEEET